MALLFLIACSPHAGVDSSDLGIGTDGGIVEPNTYEYCKTLTVSGNVFYNDLRTDGRFTLRSKASGGTGSAKPYGSGDDKNYLGMLDAKVQLYEADTQYGGGLGCLATESVGSARVLADGSWSWTGEVCDHCSTELTEDDRTLAIAAKIVLERCDDTRCFRVATADASSTSDHYADDWGGTTRSRWYRGATGTVPHLVYSNVTAVDLGTDYYQASGSQTAGDRTDLDAKAANVFASAVDVTRKVHVEGGVPFDQPEVSVYFPSTGTQSNSHSHEGGFMCIVDLTSAGSWIRDTDPAHEYGHLVHYTRWDDHGKWADGCYDADNNGTIDLATECGEGFSFMSYVNEAFKEGWADFIARVTFDHASRFGCDRNESNTIYGCPAGQICATGRHYQGDVTDVLCDLWDSAQDCNGTQCDTLALSLPTLADAVRAVWTSATQTERNEYINSSSSNKVDTPLGICELADALVAAGTSRTALINTLAVTRLNCQL